MSEVHDWCVKMLEKIKAFKKSLEDNIPAREVRDPKHSASDLYRISGEISSTLNTLDYVRKSRSLLQDLTSVVESGRSPDFAFFGPVPGVSSGASVGSAMGAAADLSGALLAVFKGARADRKMMEKIEADSSQLKNKMMHDYCRLVEQLTRYVELSAENKAYAEKFNKNGLNVPILNDAWRKAQTNQWLVFVA